MEEKVLEYQASVERVSEVERRLAVEIPWPEVKGRLDDAYLELGRGVTIKGFRRGKVPRRMLEQLFGKHVHEEVAQRLVQESISKALDANSLKAVAEPRVEDGAIADGEAFRYSATLEVVPEIEPKDYVGVAVTQRPARATDEDVERALHRKQLELTEYQPVEGRPTAQGDVLLVDIMGKIGDQPIALSRKLVELSEPPKEPLEGLAARLTGIAAQPGDHDVELELTEHQHAPGEPCPGGEVRKQAKLLVSVLDVKHRVVPELDDELAKDTGEAETLQELREKLRQELLEADEKQAREEAKRQLVDRLLEVNQVPLVPALIERHLERVAGIQMLLAGGEHERLDEIKEQLRADAERAVRSALLIEAIADKEGVTVEDRDIDERLGEIARVRSQNVAKVRSEYAKEDRLESLRRVLREEKTLELLLSQSRVTIQEPAQEPGGSRPEASKIIIP